MSAQGDQVRVTREIDFNEIVICVRKDGANLKLYNDNEHVLTLPFNRADYSEGANLFFKFDSGKVLIDG